MELQRQTSPKMFVNEDSFHLMWEGSILEEESSKKRAKLDLLQLVEQWVILRGC
jgi:hypothetical protein